jgi:hypothetical protein
VLLFYSQANAYLSKLHFVTLCIMGETEQYP